MCVPIAGFPEDFCQADIELGERDESKFGCMWDAGAADRPCCYIENFTCNGCPYDKPIADNLEIFVTKCDGCRRPIACDGSDDGLIENENFHLWGPFALCRECNEEQQYLLACDMEGVIPVVGIGWVRRLKNSMRAALAHFLGEDELSMEWSVCRG
jgi:hypothetical protein